MEQSWIIILKRKTIPKEHIPPQIVVPIQMFGWMTVGWSLDRWGLEYRPGSLLKKKALVVDDMFKTIWWIQSKQNWNHNTIIPRGLRVNPLMCPQTNHSRGNVRTLWSVDGWWSDHEYTTGENLKKPSSYGTNGYQQLGNRLGTDGHCHYCEIISNALDGTEDDILYESDSDSDSDPFANIDSNSNDSNDESV